MEKRVVTDQELALKVFAQDKDFDMFLISSRSPSSDTVRKNGVFYPLKEDGDIWIVPVMLAVPELCQNAKRHWGYYMVHGQQSDG